MTLKKTSIWFGILFFIHSCAVNPFTGQSTLALPGTSNAQLFPAAFAQYNLIMKENKVATGTKDAMMIERVGKRIAAASEKWLNANGYQGYTKGYEWEFRLIESDQINAWAMPGGKIAFYTGIIPVANNETGIAVIMAHEIAHALANHGQQRMSKGMLQQLGGLGVALATDSANPQTRQIWMQAYGIGSQVGVLLPFSRKHENEADEIGQLLMAVAGYNPNEASKLWKRMDALSNGQAPPAFLSTHPHSVDRMKNLERNASFAISEAKKFGVTKFDPIVPFKR